MHDHAPESKAKRLAAALGGWRNARPPRREEPKRAFPVPPYAVGDPVPDGIDPLERAMERMEFDHKAREFRDRLGRSPRRRDT